MGREKERREGAAQFTHMVLVSGLPLRTMWSGRNFTFHSLRAFLRHFCPPLKGHFHSFYTVGYMDNTHCATEIHRLHKENSGKLEWSQMEVDSGLNLNVIYRQGNRECPSPQPPTLLLKWVINLRSCTVFVGFLSVTWLAAILEVSLTAD